MGRALASGWQWGRTDAIGAPARPQRFAETGPRIKRLAVATLVLVQVLGVVQ